ncbi:hypothetical protein HBB16_09005 [Pseudonocardia sp. MCCB 268]|nr:hypothetical protein [Pseudonocardia cytotoxica]
MDTKMMCCRAVVRARNATGSATAVRTTRAPTRTRRPQEWRRFPVHEVQPAPDPFRRRGTTAPGAAEYFSVERDTGTSRTVPGADR